MHICGCTDAGHCTRFRERRQCTTFAILHSFTGGATDGANPYAGLIQGSDGTLNGTTYLGGTNGYGTIFQMAPDGSGYTVLLSSLTVERTERFLGPA